MRLLSTLALTLLITASLSLIACDKKTDTAKVAEEAQGLNIKAGNDEVKMKDGKLKIKGAFGNLNIDTKKGVLNIQANKADDENKAEEEKKEEGKKKAE